MMKKGILLAMALLPVAAMAQETYESLLAGEKVWTMRNKAVVPPEVYGDVYTDVEMKLEGETLINGITFKQVCKREKANGAETFGEWKATSSYIGQQDGKVYSLSTHDSQSEEPQVMVDFNAKVGDVFTLRESDTEQMEYSVTAVSDTVIENSSDRTPRKCVRVALGSETDVWVEGIGSIKYGLLGIERALDGVVQQLAKCSEGDAVLYQLEGTPTAIRNAASATQADKGAIYDLKGQRLNTPPSKGIYIQQGKKRMLF